MRPALASVALLLLCSTARADDAPEDRFFTEGGAVVAQYHLAGPATPSQSAWLRKDGHVLLRRRGGGIEGPLDDPGNGWSWREATLEQSALAKIERLARQSGICKARSTEGFSVGGAWVLAIDLGPGLRCSLRRRARLSLEPPIARLRDAVTAAIDAARRAAPVHEGVRDDAWDLGPRAPF